MTWAAPQGLLTRLQQLLGKPADPQRLIRNLRDYSDLVRAQSWQRQAIVLAVSLLTGWFFSAALAQLFFAVMMLCEYCDLTLARRVGGLCDGDADRADRLFAGYVGNTILSGLTISLYAVWIGLSVEGMGLFTALFCLFAASLFAAINNHQLALTLSIRLCLYAAAFVIITAWDLILLHPPVTSAPWLQFATVVFTMYFLIDCALRFLSMYRRNLRQIEELEREHERAKAALAVKTQFVAIVSHELRTPLTAIKGALDLANSGKFGDAPPRVGNLLRVAGRNTDRLAALVDDLLDLQKLEDGRMTFEQQTLEVGAFLTDVVAQHTDVAERYDIVLERSAERMPPVLIQSDRARLMQVMGNIISNAAKFSHPGGRVVVGHTVTEGEVRLWIRDHGVGIPEGAQDKIFDRFSQVDSSDQRRFGGTGLGMSISRDLVEGLGGRIGYDSALGQGTTFHVDLPCTVLPEEALRPLQRARAEMRHKQSLLQQS